MSISIKTHEDKLVSIEAKIADFLKRVELYLVNRYTSFPMMRFMTFPIIDSIKLSVISIWIPVCVIV